MIINLIRDDILEKLTLSSKFTSSKLTSISSLQGVFIKNEKNLIHFYATNLNSYYHTTLKIEVKGDLQIVVEPRKIIEFLTLLSPGKVDFEIKEKLLIISQVRKKGEFPLIPAGEFPLPPKITESPQKISPTFFTEELPLVFFAAAADETRPVLSGVNFVSQDEETLIVSTDGFRLSLLRQKKELDIPQMIVPAAFLSDAASLVKKEDGVLMRTSKEEKTVNFQFGEHDLYSRLIEGEYPPFEKVLPTEVKTTITIEREEFIRNIKLIAIFARDFSNVVILEVEKDGVVIKPKTDKNAGDFASQEAEVEGSEIKVAFNFKFLLDFLNHVSGKKITIELVKPETPAVFKSDSYPNFLHIIMPVRIQE